MSLGALRAFHYTHVMMSIKNISHNWSSACPSSFSFSFISLKLLIHQFHWMWKGCMELVAILLDQEILRDSKQVYILFFIILFSHSVQLEEVLFSWDETLADSTHFGFSLHHFSSLQHRQNYKTNYEKQQELLNIQIHIALGQSRPQWEAAASLTPSIYV